MHAEHNQRISLSFAVLVSVVPTQHFSGGAGLLTHAPLSTLVAHPTLAATLRYDRVSCLTLGGKTPLTEVFI